MQKIKSGGALQPQSQYSQICDELCVECLDYSSANWSFGITMAGNDYSCVWFFIYFIFFFNGAPWSAV